MNTTNPKVLAVIPARGGSKRVNRKNIRSVGGKPLIAHTIEQVDDADLVSESVVSTDDDEIKRVAIDYGGNVPFDRPVELAKDDSPTTGVVTHAINWYKDQGKEFDIVAVIQVTTPLRSSSDIDGCISKLIDDDDVDSVVSVSKYYSPPEWAVRLNANDIMAPAFEVCPLWNSTNTRSQDLNELYHPNGSVFCTSIKTWLEKNSFYTKNTAGYKMPPQRSLDIDEEWELELVRDVI